jgi:predicted O-methyltransferase YrrM
MSLLVHMLNLGHLIRERRRLGGVPTESWDPSPMRVVSPEWLTTTMADPAMAAEWASVAAEIGALNIPSTGFGVNPGDRRALYHLVRATRPQSVLEVGTNLGASTTHIALALRLNGPGGTLTTLDILPVNEPSGSPWAQAGARYSPAAMIQRLGMEPRVEFVTMPSLKYLANGKQMFDLVFLDGDHSAGTVYRELPAALRRLAPGGLVVLHDFFPDGRPLWADGRVIAGPWLAVERLRKEGAGLVVLPLGQLPWPTKLGGNLTSLALATRPA